VNGISFAIEEEGAAGVGNGLNFVGSVPHLAAEGGWTTSFTFVNKGVASAVARASLFASSGASLPLPLELPQEAALNGQLLAASLDRTIAPNASFVIQAVGPASVPYMEGSAKLAAAGKVDGFAIFHFDPTAQESVVPLETRSAPSYSVGLRQHEQCPDGRRHREHFATKRECARDSSGWLGQASWSRIDSFEWRRPYLICIVHAISYGG
jgi:hypothetical protein